MSTNRIAYWDSTTGTQQERDATPEEDADIAARRATTPTNPVPTSVSMLAARLALSSAGYLKPAAEYIAAMPGPDGERARIFWEFAANIERNNPLVLQMGVALGIDPATLDQLFIAAAAVA
jgi:hypothetical protein